MEALPSNQFQLVAMINTQHYLKRSMNDATTTDQANVTKQTQENSAT